MLPKGTNNKIYYLLMDEIWSKFPFFCLTAMNDDDRPRPQSLLSKQSGVIFSMLLCPRYQLTLLNFQIPCKYNFRIRRMSKLKHCDYHIAKGKGETKAKWWKYIHIKCIISILCSSPFSTNSIRSTSCRSSPAIHEMRDCMFSKLCKSKENDVHKMEYKCQPGNTFECRWILMWKDSGIIPINSFSINYL